MIGLLKPRVIAGHECERPVVVCGAVGGNLGRDKIPLKRLERSCQEKLTVWLRFRLEVKLPHRPVFGRGCGEANIRDGTVQVSPRLGQLGGILVLDEP